MDKVKIKITENFTLEYPNDKNALLIEGGIKGEDEIRNSILKSYGRIYLKDNPTEKLKYESFWEVPEDIVINKILDDYEKGGMNYIVSNLYLDGEQFMSPEIDQFGPFEYEIVTLDEEEIEME